METALQPKPLHEAGKYFAEQLGKDWCEDRVEVLGLLNELRELIYLEFPKLFADKFYCLEVQDFCDECISNCSCSGKLYRGVTIPSDIDGVLATWFDHEPMRNYSKWWEARSHRNSLANGPRLSTTLVHQTFPTERELRGPSILRLMAHDADDDGKVVYMKVRSNGCESEEVRVTLCSDGMVELPEIVSGIESVVLPSNLVGCVSLYEGDDYELACYPPHTTVPTYRRLKVNGDGCDQPCRIMLHGSQKFQDICFDTDIMEIGSRAILKQAALKFRYGDKSVEADEIQRGLLAENRMNKLIRSAVERNRGNNNQDPSQFDRRLHYRRPNLHGRRNRCCNRHTTN